MNNPRKYGELLFSGITAQMEKLSENEHKSGFENIDIRYAIDRIQQELSELKDAELLNDVRREAADIANFAHMIIYRIDLLQNGNTVIDNNSKI